MRIIGGRLKGRNIVPPTGLKARPTTDFAKEGLFNTLDNEFDFSQCRILDLFSGTGSISYEFASRGAVDIYSVEMNPLHSTYIKKNAAALGLKGIQVVRHNVFDFLEICKIDFDIIFADPPYAIEGLSGIPDRIFSVRIPSSEGGSSSILREGGLFILEHPSDYSFVGHPHFVKEKKYGNVHFSFFR